MAGYVIVVSGPSAAGKTTLMREICSQCDGQRLSQVVTYTTRAPRAGEQDGVHYHFVDQATFWQYYHAGSFIEYSCAYGACYASAWDPITHIPEGEARVMVIDRAGAYRVMQACDNVISIWVAPSSVEQLRDRLIQRGVAQDNIGHRIAQSQHEMELERDHPIYTHHVTNDDFDTACDQLMACIGRYI